MLGKYRATESHSQPFGSVWIKQFLYIPPPAAQGELSLKTRL